MFFFNKIIINSLLFLMMSSIYTNQYPSIVNHNAYGKCLIATQDIEIGTIVEKFIGPKMKYEEVPLEEICYVGCHRDGFWTIPVTSARYINHSCDPNCSMNENGDVVALRAINEGEELTFDYVTINQEIFEQNPKNYFWDPRWSFECQCNATNCYQHIDRYIIK